jgi:phosphotransferase system  glucose/maltose/N-acetylglucosamine-specific IIC component
VIELTFANLFLFFVALIAAMVVVGCLAYVIFYCAVRGAWAGFVRSMHETSEHNNQHGQGG